jgi:murein L,D-transpeptidase YafK
MARHKYSYYADFWKQLKPGYDYLSRLTSRRWSRCRWPLRGQQPLSHEVVQPQLASNYTVPETK